MSLRATPEFAGEAEISSWIGLRDESPGNAATAEAEEAEIPLWIRLRSRVCARDTKSLRFGENYFAGGGARGLIAVRRSRPMV